MTKEAIIVPDTEQISEIPTISLCGGYKGHMAIQLEFGEMIIKDFLDNLDDAAVIGLIAKMKAFRDGGVIIE